MTTSGENGGKILVLGASGYVGGRLVPDLLEQGYSVRCMTRSPERLESVEWVAEHRAEPSSSLEIVAGDLSEPSTLATVFADIDQVVYLVHSLNEENFEKKERDAAQAACEAMRQAGVDRVVYLSGLGNESDDLSAHLRSRHAVGRELAQGTAAVTELRAAVVLGAGSASFEMMRSLVDVLPVMIAPRWVTTTRLQPIAIQDVLTYLSGALASPRRSDEGHRIVEVGGPDVLTYAELMCRYADVARLRRYVFPVPVLSLGLSAHWVNLVTPIPRRLASSLIDSLEHDVVVTDDSAHDLSAHQPIGVDAAIESALSAIQDLDIPTRWSGVSSRSQTARPRPWDAEWAGGTVYEDRRERTTSASSDAVQRTVRGIGGQRGWFGFGPLWRLRGLLDKLAGGVGLRRGRRHPDLTGVGEAIDFWRVDALEDGLFRLRAEMLLPGEAWLEWSSDATDDVGTTLVVQRARYVPNGLLGRLYWWVLVPFHAAIFPIMLRRIVRAAEQQSV